MRSEEWIHLLLDQLKAQNLERRLEVWDCDSYNSSVLNFSSNDYLNLSRRSEVIRSGTAVERCGSGSARLISGTLPCHHQLEEALAGFLGHEASLLFGAGYLANLGLLTALLGRHDLVFSDRAVHASLIDGIRLSGAKNLRFRHNDMCHLEEMLKKAHCLRRPNGHSLVVVESVYSMDGDLAPLVEICSLAEKFDSAVIVDEAHALGVFGDSGRGLVAALGLGGQVQCCTATLSKALGSYGGVVAGSALLRRLLINKSRPFIYNTALPPGVVQGAAQALRILQREPILGSQLLRRAAIFRDLLAAGGLNVMKSQSQIIPLLIGNNERALLLSQRLRALGIIAMAIRSPTVPAGTARLRFSVTLAQQEDDLRQAAGVIVEEVKRVELS